MCDILNYFCILRIEMKKFNYIDLFAGAVSEGFIRAGYVCFNF